jgi:hypothetical protein
MNILAQTFRIDMQRIPALVYVDCCPGERNYVWIPFSCNLFPRSSTISSSAAAVGILKTSSTDLPPIPLLAQALHVTNSNYFPKTYQVAAGCRISILASALSGDNEKTDTISDVIKG